MNNKKALTLSKNVRSNVPRPPHEHWNGTKQEEKGKDAGHVAAGMALGTGRQKRMGGGQNN